jgi:phosphohistidine phosphatase
MTDPSARRTLILLRHAKSEWPDVPDHDRPLAERGRRDAPVVGGWLAESGHVPDQVLCSSARRTRETWELVREQLGADPAVVVEDRVYQATPGSLLEVIRQVEPSRRTVLVVGHAPAVPGLAALLPAEAAPGADGSAAAAQERIREKYPTASATIMEFDGDWARLQPGAVRLIAFVTPRELQPDQGTDPADAD